MIKPTSEISINVLAQKEGILLYKTLRNVWAGYVYSERKGIKPIEFQIYLDCSDKETKKVVNKFVKEHPVVSVHELEYGDSGLSKNYLIHKSSGRYIAIVEGGDLLTENFLFESYGLAERLQEPAVFSAEFVVNFGTDDFITPNLDFKSKEFEPVNIFEHNYFNSPTFVNQEIYKHIQYAQKGEIYSNEGWNWSTRAIAAGYKFYNVPETIIFQRKSRRDVYAKGLDSIDPAISPSSALSPGVFSKFTVIQDKKLPAESETDSLNKPKHGPLVRTKARALGLLTKTIKPNSATYRYLHQQYHLNRFMVARVISVMKSRYARIISRPGEAPHPSGDGATLIDAAPARLSSIGLNSNHINEWSKMNQFEPMLRPSFDALESLEIRLHSSGSVLSEAYYQFCKKYAGAGFTDIILVPHLIRGGADLAAINLIKSLARQNRKLLVLTTADIESPWGQMIDDIDNVTFIELHDLLDRCPYSQKLQFVLRIIQNWNINHLTVINSLLGYDLIRDYGPVIKPHVRVFLHTYAFDMSIEGYLFNMIPNGLVDCYPYVDLYITDSEGYKHQLSEVNGFDDNKVRCIYLPIETNIKPKSEHSLKRKVLWASRISDAKLVEVAVQVGAELGKRGIELHFYGAIEHQYAMGDSFKKMIQPHNNIRYKGAYDGFSSIDLNEYDLFLLTSKNEGMPNVVLEAVLGGVFVVAPAVGGIPEVITEGVNGYLVERNFVSNEYIEKIVEFYNSHKSFDFDKQLQLNRKIQERHSLAAYDKRVNSIYTHG